MREMTFPTGIQETQGHNVPLHYSAAWSKLITRLYGYTMFSLTTVDNRGQLTGYLPLCLISSPLTGKRLVSLPFADHSPLLATSDEGAQDLLSQAITLAQHHRVRYLELRTGSNEFLARQHDLVVENLYVRWLLPLTPDPTTLWSGLRKPVQHQVKKARKLGVTVSIAHDRSEMEHYYRLHLHTRCKKHGMPAQPRAFFEGLWDAFAATGNIQLLLAHHEGTVIAGMLLLASGSTVRYAYGASDERYLNLAPNNLLMWTAIEWGCTHGYDTLDMGRTAYDNEGLMEFKRRWGAHQEPLPYYYHPATAGLAATSEQSKKFQVLTACWRQLPLTIAGPLGGSLYKHLG